MRISDWSSDVCSSDLLLEQAVHDARAARVGQEFAVIADQPARRRREGNPGLADARWPHVGEFRLPHRHLFDDGAGMLLVHVDDDGSILFFATAALSFVQDTLGAAYPSPQPRLGPCTAAAHQLTLPAYPPLTY